MTTPGFFELYPAARPALPAGAYTATYSTVGFNGFAPLPTVLL